MITEILQAAVIINILAATIRIATPLLLGAMGELVAERSGVMNMGLEGMMLFGVFTVWLVTFLGGTTVMGGGVALICELWELTLSLLSSRASISIFVNPFSS